MFKRPAPPTSWRQWLQAFNTRQREPVNPATNRWTGTAERSGNITDGVTTMQHQHGGEPPGVVFVLCFMDSFLHQASFGSGDWCYDRHRSVRLVIFSFWRLIRSHNPGWVPSKWPTIPRSYLVSKYEKLYRVISLISKNVSHAHFLFMVSIYRIYEYNKRLIQSFAKDITLYQIFSLSKTSVR